MLSNLDNVEISSEKESPIHPTTILEEVTSMPVGLIPWGKWKAQKPGSTPPQKRQTHTSIRVQGEGTT